jgi:hypothetical protein
MRSSTEKLRCARYRSCAILRSSGSLKSTRIRRADYRVRVMTTASPGGSIHTRRRPRKSPKGRLSNRLGATLTSITSLTSPTTSQLRMSPRSKHSPVPRVTTCAVSRNGETRTISTSIRKPGSWWAMGFINGTRRVLGAGLP